MNTLKKVFFLLISLSCTPNFADNKIIAFFEHAPEKVVRSVQKELEIPHTKNLLPPLGGIPALYGGYLSYSNKIEFPLRHASPKLYIVITPSLRVVKKQEESVAYLALDTKKGEAAKPLQETTLSTTATPGMEAVIEKDATQGAPKIYLFEKKQDEKKVWFWSVTEEKVPQSGKINPISLILVTNPDNIYIKTGYYQATEDAHLRLPPLYIVGSIDKDTNLLKFLDLSRYFEPLQTERKEEAEPAKVTSSIMITN